MATSQDFIEFVCEQIRGDYAVRYKKMFGEYIAYVNDKPVLLVCDNTVYVKKLAEVAELMIGAPLAVPYEGTKEHYVLDIENTELVQQVVAVLERVTPLPKKKSKKTV